MATRLTEITLEELYDSFQGILITSERQTIVQGFGERVVDTFEKRYSI